MAVRGLEPLPYWIGDARRAALGLRATTLAARGAAHSVYVVLLEDPRRACRWGLYVGETSRDPDLRFDQHKAGYKASAVVRSTPSTVPCSGRRNDSSASPTRPIPAPTITPDPISAMADIRMVRSRGADR